MKHIEDLQKVIQQLVDLTNQDEANNLQLIKMPELALVMAKYFVNLSKMCLTHYQSYSKTSKKGERQKKERGKKEREDDDLLVCPPKKPLTAYILYFQERVPSFQQKYPKYTISQLTRLIAKQWKQVSEDIKRPYIERAAADRKRYQNDKKNYKLKKGLKKIDQEESNRNAEESEEHSDDPQKQKLLVQEVEEQQLQEGI